MADLSQYGTVSKPGKVDLSQYGTVGASQPKDASTGDSYLDGVIGFTGKAVQRGIDAYKLLRQIPGAEKVLPDPSEFEKSIKDATPDNTPAHVGQWLEGAAEFALPASKMTAATRGMGLIARATGQAAVGGTVSAVQSGGDPVSTATGAVLGAAGELVPAAASGVKSLIRGKAPTLANFSESFGGATPTQKARISRTLDVLSRDGIVPPDSVHEMQDIIKGKMQDLEQAYRDVPAAIKARETDPSDVIEHLKELQQQYTRRGVVTDKSAYNTIGNEIAKVEAIAMKNGGAPARTSLLVGPNGQPIPGAGAVPGKINVDDIVHLKQGANGRTNWNSPESEKSLWRGIGDAYRGSADILAPEITPINQDYQKYTDLEHIIDQNIARGKGVSPSGLDSLLKRASQHGAGVAAGAAVGGAVAGPVGSAAGAVVGGIAGPRIGRAAAQAIQNAVDSGAFKALSPAKQAAVRSMAAIGDNAGILRVLGISATEESAAGR